MGKLARLTVTILLVLGTTAAHGHAECTVPRASIDDSIVVDAARFVPAIRRGRFAGYKVFAIKPGSVAEVVGLQPGDSVVEVNGIVLDQESSPRQLAGQAVAATSVELRIERNGEPAELTCRVDQ